MLSFIKNYFKSAPIEDQFTWKYIDIDDTLIEEIKGRYLKVLPTFTNKQQYFTLPIDIPDINGIKVLQSRLIYVDGYFDYPFAHKDTINKVNSNRHVLGAPWALNIPLINCENSVTTLYEDSKHSVELPSDTQITKLLLISKATPVTSYVLDRPILFNSQMFHAVKNNSATPRIAISLRFENNPVEWV